MDSIRAVTAALVAVAALLGLTVDAFAEPDTAQQADRAADPVAGRAGDPVEDPAGTWDWPLLPRPEVVAGFDPPTTPYGPGHVGVDLLGWPGQVVLAVATGEVSFAGQVAGTPVVSMVHAGERSTYQPVVAAVRRGDLVARGQPIGTLSNAGSHCLPLTCLHLGRRAGDTYLDPMELLDGGPVRLLPRSQKPAVSPGSYSTRQTTRAPTVSTGANNTNNTNGANGANGEQWAGQRLELATTRAVRQALNLGIAESSSEG